MEFEWNAEKRRSNIAKHGVDSLDAVGIFIGNVLERTDDRSDYGEVRVIATGIVDTSVVTVVYTSRGEYRRIISARKAHTNERRAYYQAYPTANE